MTKKKFKTFDDLKFFIIPTCSERIAQIVFDNGFGVSVTVGPYTHSDTDHPYEGAVMKEDEGFVHQIIFKWGSCGLPERYIIVSDPKRQHRIFGWSTEDEITEIMQVVQGLEPINKEVL